jgi:hypothetical protein
MNNHPDSGIIDDLAYEEADARANQRTASQRVTLLASPACAVPPAAGLDSISLPGLCKILVATWSAS